MQQPRDPRSMRKEYHAPVVSRVIIDPVKEMLTACGTQTTSGKVSPSFDTNGCIACCAVSS